MAKKISIPYHLVADPGAEDDVVLYTVEAARKFKTKSVYLFFPIGNYMELQVRIFRGMQQIAPYKNYYTGDGNVIEDEFIEDMSSGERVILHYKNTNSTQQREAFIIVRGELE